MQVAVRVPVNVIVIKYYQRLSSRKMKGQIESQAQLLYPNKIYYAQSVRPSLRETSYFAPTPADQVRLKAPKGALTPMSSFQNQLISDNFRRNYAKTKLFTLKNKTI